MLERRFEELGEYRIHAVRAGRGEPIVLLHGLSGSHHWWRYTLPFLAERYEVHAPELVGFGRSRPGTLPGIGAMAEVLMDWIRRCGLERPHLIGHSMGGQIAIHLAARHGAALRRLVLAAPSGIPRERRLPEVARLLSELIPPRAWGRIGFWPTVVVDAARAGPLTLLGAARALLTDDVRPLLSSIENETLLLWGEHDPLVPVRHGHEMAQVIPNARIVVLAHAAHNVMADRPRAFNANVLEFLESA